MFAAQQYATAVYRAELAARVQRLGYEIERGEHGKFEIRGYMGQYLRAESPRREQIKETAAERARLYIPRRSIRLHGETAVLSPSGPINGKTPDLLQSFFGGLS